MHQKQKPHKVCMTVVCLLIGLAGRTITAVPQSYDTSHESIASYDVPAWYSEGKLGVFMHLSAFSVPAYRNEWYATNMYYAEDNPTLIHKEYRKTFRDHHEKTYGSLKEFGYKDLFLC